MAGMAEVLAEGTGYPGMTGIIPCFVLYRCNVCNGAGSIAKSLDNGRFFIFIRALFSLRQKKSISSFHTYQKDRRDERQGWPLRHL